MGKDDENFYKNSCDSLKSLLKKPGTKSKSSHHVVFNENKNEFFDADYIILIREECEFDDDEDEVCTCSEMVPRICCDTNCECNVYDFHEQTPQSPKFAPPIEFVDNVTLSPPEGYKDMELNDTQTSAIEELATSAPKAAVCKECIASKKEAEQNSEETSEVPLSNQTDLQKLEEDKLHLVTSPISGILKGGMLWKHHGCDFTNDIENSQNIKLPDEEGFTQRAVRFIENGEDSHQHSYEEQEGHLLFDDKENNVSKLSSQEATEMLLTFKFGNVLISNNSLKPNSAVRQLFPNTKTKDLENGRSNYPVNANIFQAFDQTKISKLPQKIKKCDKKITEHMSFRRSLIRYEPKTKKTLKKEDNSLVERIKLLTCDLDESNADIHNISERVSPTGEESHEYHEVVHIKPYVKNSSPSSSSTSSNSSSLSSTYKKITDLFTKKERNIEIHSSDDGQSRLTPDLNEPQNHLNKCQVKVNTIIDNKKQLLSTLVPLTACVNISNPNEYNYNGNNDFAHATISSSTNTENANEQKTINGEDFKVNTPDVLAGTPTAVEYIHELPGFLSQNVGGIEGISTKCQPENCLIKEDDEHDDYGFNKRPSVQGVKHRCVASTEIQNHLDVSDIDTKVTWPYYSESSFTENNQNTSKIVPEEINTRVICPHPIKENSSYQNYYNKKIMRGSCNTNIDTHSAIIGIEVDYNEYYIPQSKSRNNRPLSPPPQDFSRNYHAMVYIPYNHIEGYRSINSPNHYYQTNDILKSTNMTPQNEIYDQFYQQKVYQETPSSSIIPPTLNHRQNMYLRSNQIYSNESCSNDESSFVTHTSVKSTQTLSTPLLACSYFHNIKCKSISPKWTNLENYNNTNNGHSLPSIKASYPNKTENIKLEDNFIYNKQMSNENKDYIDFNNYLSPDSSKSLKFMERGVPEGAASVSPVSTTIRSESSCSIITSPSSSHFKSFYAMNV